LAETSASVAAASIQSDLNLSNNAANATMTVVEQADLALTSTVAPSPTKSGQSLTYLLSLRNDVGLLSEEYDPAQGRSLGNHPQAYSHLGLIGNALTLSRP